MPNNDNSNRPSAVPTGQTSRFLRFGGLAAGIGGNVALHAAKDLARGQRPDLRDLMLTPRNVQKLTDQLSQMRGAAMKMGQLMSMDGGDVLPPELTDILAKLRDQATFMPPKQLREVLNEAWGSDWLNAFKHFNVRPIAAASIGQVHRAILRDGRELAIKVQYPGVAQSIDADIANLGRLMKMSGLMPQGFDPTPYLAAAREQLHEETDYAREGACLARFGVRLKDDAGFAVPGFVEEWSSDKVLAMTFLSGQPIETLSGSDQATRDGAIARLIDLTFRELFEWRDMQTDPNFANYLYDPDSGRIVLLDFGAAREIPDIVSAQYRDLMAAGLAGDGDSVWAAALQTGIVSNDTPAPHAARLRAMMDMAAQSFSAGDVYDFSDQTLSRAMQREGEELARDGFLPPEVPMDLLFVQRKLAGLFLLATRLKARVPIRELFSPYA